MPSERPNILFLLSDEHSFRFLGCLPEEEGGEAVETPHLDRLAERGTLFTDAYCQMPLCTPSRLCLLAGREVRGAGAWSNESVLRPGLPTLPGVLAEAGYSTCLIGKMHLGGNRQFVGFQHRPYGDLTGRTGHQWEPLRRPEARSMRARTALAVGVTEIPESLLQEQIVAQETVAFLREHQARWPGRPWFLMASFSRPHFPLTAPGRWIRRYPPTAISEPRVPPAGDAYHHPMSVGMRRGFQAEAIGHEEMMRARAAYFACVSFLDEVIGDLLLRLEASGLLENTLIVYTSDHGEMAGEHGVWWKHGWYEACTRVPLILSTPEQRTGRQPARWVRTPVGLIDLFPTLCGLAGVSTPEGLDGANLAAVVRGEGEPPERPIVSDNLVPRWGAGTEFRMVRWRRYKYVRFRNAPPLFFDLQEDPGEQRNLLQRGMSAEAQEAHRELNAFVDRTMDFQRAEWERTVRDGDLKRRYPLNAPSSTPNLYWMPSGRLVNADDVLYHPTVIAEDPTELFDDAPDRGPESSL
ncbi:MAG: sulfatase [Candidatus Poribacteria bacterium]|nr:MAG: sulfatase [Candidatus Poribacteria bacterium]